MPSQLESSETHEEPRRNAEIASDLLPLLDLARREPTSAEAHYQLGRALEALGRKSEAIATYTIAANLPPEHLGAKIALANLLVKRRRLDAAEKLFASMVISHPTATDVHFGLAKVLVQLGRGDEAISHFRIATALAPDRAEIGAALIGNLHGQPDLDRNTIALEQATWTQHHVVAPPQPNSTQRPEPLVSQRLRIGYLSRHFEEHAEAYFTLPLIEAHNRDAVEVHCYAAAKGFDAIGRRIKNAAYGWHDIHSLGAVELAEKIQTDHIDILVNCSQHFFPVGLLACARRAAPLQVSWLPFVDADGFGFFDYRISDPLVDPIGDTSLPTTDRVIRLPNSAVCFESIGHPEVEGLPAARTGRITFGALNRFPKVNDAVLRCWARILDNISGSQLRLRCPPGSARNRVLGTFGDLGIASERVVFVEQQPRTEFLRNYHAIDIALDSFPYNGSATTCDALWMGVPVVTLRGQTGVSRAGLSLLTNVGLADCVAQDESDYVRIVVRLASDISCLAELRSSLRSQMRASSLMDAGHYAASLEAAYRLVWDRQNAKQ